MYAMANTVNSLSQLEDRLAQDLSLLELPPKEWVPPTKYRGDHVFDVVVIGAGMCGLVAAASLRMVGIANVVCLDRAAPGKEGPWVTFARMETLRSPKQLTGPALGLPSLTFRAWYLAQFGDEAWESLDKIPRVQWMEYLIWYREVLSLQVRNHACVIGMEALGDEILGLDINNDGTGSTERIYARHVVLATGRDGLGGSYTPEITSTISRKFWAHSADPIDFQALRGKRVAVVGAGASAMDNAATALEAGAIAVDMLIRRKDLPRVNKFTGISSQGVVEGFAGLSDEWKWRFLDHVIGSQTPPPRDSTRRVSRHPSGRFLLGASILGLNEADGELTVTTNLGELKYDFVIFSTGFRVDLSRRPELHNFAQHIRFWSDAYKPAAGCENGELATSPYLGPGFEFTERIPGECPALSLIHCFNYPASLSHGKLSGDIPAVTDGGRRLASSIARSLFVADREYHYANLIAYNTPELQGDEWTDSSALLDDLRRGAAE